MQKYLGLVASVLTLIVGQQTFASSLTVRDIKLLGQGKIEIQLDGTPSKSAFEIDYVRDIVQFSIQNATIYPAKILHSDEDAGSFSKVFAYQYAPNLVRVRFSVDGKADQFQGKVKWSQNGKFLTVSFPAGIAKAQPKKETESNHERSLLAKVLGQSHEEPKVEKIEDKEVVAVKAEPKTEAKAEPAVKAESETATTFENPESKIFLNTDKHKNADVHLGGAPKGASPLRAFLAMFLVVGGLGLVLFYVKKKKGSAQAKKVGDSWISNLLGGSKKQKAMIELIATYPLGPKQSITVVRIRGQQLVLGVTEGNVQLITQLDSDDDVDVMDDPKVADSIGKIFGGKPAVMAHPASQKAPAPRAPVQNPINDAVTASFGNMLKNSSGAGAIVARNAYQSQQPRIQVAASDQAPATLQSSVRNQIKQRLQGMRN